jgi:hypothetical protein
MPTRNRNRGDFVGPSEGLPQGRDKRSEGLPQGRDKRWEISIRQSSKDELRGTPPLRDDRRHPILHLARSAVLPHLEGPLLFLEMTLG